MNSKMNTKKTLLASMVGLFAAAGGASSAMAQGDEAATAQGRIDEIIVTARYREESAQDIGMSLKALSGDDLKRMGAQDFKDIALRIPGLNIADRGPNQNNISMRGLSNLIFTSTFQRNNPLIGMYLDDVSVVTSFSTQRSFNLFDLESVEVVKGPQGTLYGEGAMGGAIRYQTKRPVLDEFQGKIGMTFGSTKNADDLNSRVDGTMNIPLIDNEFGLRLTAFHQKDAGYIDFTGETSGDSIGSVLTNIPRDNANEYEAYGVRGVFLAEPNDDLSARLSVTYEKSEADTEFVVSKGAPDLTNTDYFNLSPHRDDVVALSARIDYQVNNGTFSSITGYVDRERFDGGQQGGVSFLFFSPSTNDFDFSEESLSQEFRFVSKLDGPFNYLAGLYYKVVDTESDIKIVSALDPSPGTILDEDEFYDAKQIAVFGEANYSLKENLVVTVGLRYFKEEVDSNQIWFEPEFLFSGFPENSFSASLVVEEILPKVLLEYAASDSVLFYGTASKGARNGGLNATSTVSIAEALGTSLPRTYEEDTAWSYEIGAKAQWLDTRLTTNFSLYYIDWSNLQANAIDISTGTAIGFLQNVGDATSKGFEAEVVFNVNDTLSVYFAGNASQAELDDTFVIGVGAESAKNARIPHTPELSISTGIDLDYPLDHLFGKSINLVAHLDYQFISEQATDIEQIPDSPLFFEIDQHEISNFRIGLESDKWNISLFANNLFDERTIFTENFSRLQFINKPRTIGLALTANF